MASPARGRDSATPESLPAGLWLDVGVWLADGEGPGNSLRRGNTSTAPLDRFLLPQNSRFTGWRIGWQQVDNVGEPWGTSGGATRKSRQLLTTHGNANN